MPSCHDPTEGAGRSRKMAWWDGTGAQLGLTSEVDSPAYSRRSALDARDRLILKEQLRTFQVPIASPTGDFHILGTNGDI